MVGISASPSCTSPALQTSRYCPPVHAPYRSPTLLPPSNLKPRSFTGSYGRGGVQCSSSRKPHPGSDESESKAVLDAFFLGKAFAEALNERIGSTVGEILSVVGQWQAEQQKQVQDFQEEVIERAKKAKERAAVEVMEEQSVASKALSPRPDTGNPAAPPPSPGSSTTEDPLQAMLKD